jgi:hypothetical protein
MGDVAIRTVRGVTIAEEIRGRVTPRRLTITRNWGDDRAPEAVGKPTAVSTRETRPAGGARRDGGQPRVRGRQHAVTEGAGGGRHCGLPHPAGRQFTAAVLAPTVTLLDETLTNAGRHVSCCSAFAAGRAQHRRAGTEPANGS